jgi:hypothetical protein
MLNATVSSSPELSAPPALESLESLEQAARAAAMEMASAAEARRHPGRGFEFRDMREFRSASRERETIRRYEQCAVSGWLSSL